MAKLLGDSINYILRKIIGQKNKVLAEIIINWPRIVGAELSGFEHDTTCGQNYQTISSTVFQNLEHLLIKNYLETKTDTNYRRRAQT